MACLVHDGGLVLNRIVSISMDLPRDNQKELDDSMIRHFATINCALPCSHKTFFKMDRWIAQFYGNKIHGNRQVALNIRSKLYHFSFDNHRKRPWNVGQCLGTSRVDCSLASP